MGKHKNLIIIGGGPAGLAAAVAAHDAGVTDILIIERDERLGGILNQCIHNGFGLHTFKEELTGPEYADRYIERVKELGIPYRLSTIVTDLKEDTVSDGSDENVNPSDGKKTMQGCKKLVTTMNGEEGMVTYSADAVILAMGCRERARGALNIPGTRPAGIYTAGTAQYFVNLEGRMPGREVVILGSGDIGLIMARRMTLEGAHVQLVAELQPYSGGLKRNIVQCLDDFGIPLMLSHTVVKIHGNKRLEGVTIAEVDEKLKPVPGTEKYYPCDTLLLSCGLLPENELSSQLGVELSRVTGGAVVNESLETSVKGVFSCGNVLHVHDLVDYVSEEAAAAGRNAAEYISRLTESGAGKGSETDEEPVQTGRGTVSDAITIVPEGGVRYTVPVTIRPAHMAELTTVRFRVGAIKKDVDVVVYADGRELSRIHKRIMAPGEMEQVILKKDNVLSGGVPAELKITIE
ncbi:MAG: FAD-dependent oxidoreductase [Lachnospiraceae bacterium]|nr:FAD-dependent oxidoreductase [Lachnospiraceae bacterium]